MFTATNNTQKNSVLPQGEDYITIPKKEYEQLQSQSQQLTELRRLVFGSKSERFITNIEDGQTSLFDLKTEQQPAPQTQEVNYKRRVGKNKPVRTALPANLPRQEEIIEPDSLPNGSIKIGEEITEQLEYVPGKLFVRKIIRPKYALPKNQGITIATLPTLTLPKSNAGSSILAYLMVSKYVDHLPFYRMVQIFKREDITLSESTINGWLKAVSELLEVLYDSMKVELLKQSYLQADESPIKVLSKNKPKATHTGYHWVYHSPEKKLAVFDYRTSRSSKGPKEFLAGFHGYLQTDGYAAYNNFHENQPQQVVLLACMAHARRYFEKAIDNDRARATYALELIQKLYAIERMVKQQDYSAQQLLEARQQQAEPILTEFKQWLDKTILEVTPKSAIGKAVAYTLNLWERLTRYIEQPRFCIDNNLIENLIRPLAVGRKNYLFAGSHHGAKRAAMMYSFFATCKLNNVNPYQWLKQVLTVIPDYKVNKIQELIPYNFSKNINDDPK